LFPDTLGRPRPDRGPRRCRIAVGLRSSPGRPCRPEILGPHPWAMAGLSVTALRQPLPPRLSLLLAHPPRSVPHGRDSAGSPPGFLNIDWRSGCADSNPSWLYAKFSEVRRCSTEEGTFHSSQAKRCRGGHALQGRHDCGFFRQGETTQHHRTRLELFLPRLGGVRWCPMVIETL
jgi:hypothetical protein